MLARGAFGNENAQDEEDYAEDAKKYYPNEPDWVNIFPLKRDYPEEVEREAPDWLSLKPSDPLFLDMGWPTERGPLATAYAKHVQWKRRLTDGERRSWQKWAVYRRLLQGKQFDYSVEDYVLQSLTRDVARRAAKAEAQPGQLVDAAVFGAACKQFEEEERPEVEVGC
jgi:hypothetical protein